MEHFENISAEEIKVLQGAFPLITVLIAGADGNIDVDEKYWAGKIAHIRTYAKPDQMNAFYEEMQPGFQSALESLIDAMPKDLAEREQKVSADLKSVNPVLAKLSPETAYIMYKGYLSFAEHVAKASGGFMGFFSVDSNEKKLLGLDMITPIEAPPEEV